MIILSAGSLALRFGVKTIFENISFSLEENTKVGIIGVNGCGKTSLLKIILGEYKPDEGQIYIAKDTTIGHLAQDTLLQISDADGTDGSLTLLEKMYQSFPALVRAEEKLAKLEAKLSEADRNTVADYSQTHDWFIQNGGLSYKSRCASMLSKIGFPESMHRQKVVTLSGGQKTRLALAVLLVQEPDILMLDEPTNHLDIETTQWLETFLSNYHKCVIVISHDRYFLDRVTGKTLVMEWGGAKLYNGNYTASMAQRLADREAQQKKWEQQQKELAHHEAVIAQQKKWNQAHNYVTIRARQKMIDRMDLVEKPKEAPKSIRMRFVSSLASGNDVLSVRNLTMRYGSKVLFEDMSFLLKRGEKTFIIGPNGSGKSTLIRLITGLAEPTSGVIEAGYNVEIGYYDQENQNLTPENTVLDELWNAYPSLTETTIRNTLGLFRFVGDEVFLPVSVLSGGQRARLTLAKLILSKMNLLILDEPTNHLDIDSREALETALQNFSATVLIVSHDRYLIDKLATRIIEISPGPAFGTSYADYYVSHVGHGYEEYAAFKENRLARMTGTESERTEPMSRGKEEYLIRKKQQSEIRKKDRTVEALKKEASDLEAELDNVEKQLYGEAATDYQKAAELDSRRQQIEERILQIYSRLEELESGF
ncbi:MAG: ABC-F family ATP-binding cassette domain-containing protein [Clostridia bacterium]|nr:ABC-F family ATP-binding cassette domain-containing protein [Clostridia bacterium]